MHAHLTGVGQRGVADNTTIYRCHTTYLGKFVHSEVYFIFSKWLIWYDAWHSINALTDNMDATLS